MGVSPMGGMERIFPVHPVVVRTESTKPLKAKGGQNGGKSGVYSFASALMIACPSASSQAPVHSITTPARCFLENPMKEQ